MNPRWIASQCLLNVIDKKHSLTETLATHIDEGNQNSALIKDICFGSLRWHYHLDAILAQLLVKPLKNKDKDVECLIRVGLYQLAYQQTPNHAAVNETVSASKHLKKKWSKGLINGVLRSYLRKRQDIDEILKADTQLAYSHPTWIINKLQQAWPNDWQSLLEAANERAPMTIRVNPEHYSRDAYLELLNNNNIEAIATPHVNSAITLKTPCSVALLPNFDRGACSIQDASAQLAASLLPCEPNMRVLDACAAPGGKTGHLLECYPDINLTALDSSSTRLDKVRQNLNRLGKQATLISADAGYIESWFDGGLYDRILLDAPCSATGVIRRHPDIKLLRQASDIEQVCEEQQKILEQLWRVLKPGGLLLYATCSILPEENDKQIANFVKNHNDVNIMAIDAPWGTRLDYGRQILTQTLMDGFFYSLLEKCNTNDVE